MTLDKRILDIMKRYMGMLVSKKVLTTMEEVEANTNETNLVAAPVVAELNDKLAGQPEFLYDASGKITGYKTPGGADTVFPFTDTKTKGATFSLSEVGSSDPSGGSPTSYFPTFGKKVRVTVGAQQTSLFTHNGSGWVRYGGYGYVSNATMDLSGTPYIGIAGSNGWRGTATFTFLE
ncbi:MAG: hypothetical protein HFI62_02965 [Lachnospiraceae bacterium]|jgi:hypothetical protein|nr:hypothetical protein [Lachnospiraceae bacterium]